MKHRVPPAIAGMVVFVLVFAFVTAFFSIWADRANASDWNTTESGNFKIDGYDGVITIRDNYGMNMVVTAACAAVIEHSGIERLEDIHHGLTATPEYIAKCFEGEPNA